MDRKRNPDGGLRTGSRGRGMLRSVRSAVEHTEPVLEIESTLTFVLLAILMVPVGLFALVVSMLLLTGVYWVIGTPTGTIGVVFNVGWLALTVGALFLLFRAIYRRLPRRMREHAVPGLGDDHPAADPRDGADARRAAGVPSPTPSIEELDARFAPDPPPR
jgi:energy-coupling factor transporter transmembrane protein EcfT